MVLFATLFAMPAMAQTTSEVLKMTSGTRQVPANGPRAAAGKRRESDSP